MTAKPPTEDGHHGFVHVTAEDVTVAEVPSPEQARAIDLLELNPTGAVAVRLSWLQWEHVDRTVLALGALGVPPARPASDAIPVQRARAVPLPIEVVEVAP